MVVMMSVKCKRQTYLYTPERAHVLSNTGTLVV